ncbi:related to MTQ2 - Putative S-adenosylmethionine-dependent methyltransferase [Melanopsichium pennsylvanicum]|uniref:Related to MTQ2 - Putative S-adenosylmethionine-dependent methyltransferase n=1 Tax=Melanopsichium pennsylvanicum TaxID=63383 RepID=A0AAJ5C3S1_9BASI|nr:related to MTQ2 - Putative S-adenosylmethionine-dependent methyltransferase [Melanopsichium pennsylvanicum]
MIPTPSTSHLTKKDFRKVYEPAEDSFILLDALEADASLLSSSLLRSSTSSSPLCVEIGSGSGIVLSFLSAILGSTSATYIGTDLNPHANKCTISTGKANGVAIGAVNTSLMSGLRPRIDGKVNVLLFNPPYVPTEEDEEQMAQGNPGIEGSWAGGSTGTNLVDTLIDEGVIKQVLAPEGRLYLVAIKQNDPARLVKRLQAQELDAEVVLARRAGREHLHVIRATKP